jgi:predicted AlkP superfamily pyrophosphatase or phosphodiesterase
MRKRLLVIQVAALARDLDAKVEHLTFRPIQSVLPAVTCTVQASFRTAAAPSKHGMIANGLYHRDLHRPMFWEQSADLVRGPRIWDDFRRRGGRAAMLFWQQSLGETVDVVLSPAPVHKHHGGMIQDCYCQPPGLYDRLCRRIGRRFKLQHYWGPLASAKVGEWIADATVAVLRDDSPGVDLCMVYLPSLDYDFQRWGPRHAKSRRALERTQEQLGRMVTPARELGCEVLVFGDYAIRQTASGDAAVLPNRALRDSGLMMTRDVRGMLYADFHASRAFAMVDHEVAHVYVKNPDDIQPALTVLGSTPGVAEVLDRPAQAKIGLDHPNSGELVIVAEEGKWLAYPWWSVKSEAPDYARHIDIHNKPGYDPCELFLGWPPISVSQDTARIRGSHGRVGPGREVAWASTVEFGMPSTLIELAEALRAWLNE